MESMQVLEQKVGLLVARIKDLQSQISNLLQENTDLKRKLDALETTLLAGQESMEEEKAITKIAVEELIKSIEAIMPQDQL
jgi:regulator of replication initiation timing